MENFNNTSAGSGPVESWPLQLIDQVRFGVQDDAVWTNRVRDCTTWGDSGSSLHLAVFVEPYLDLLMAGTKTIESRFSQNGGAPFEQIWPGDLVLLKRSGGDINGIARVGEVRNVKRCDRAWNDLRTLYQHQLCAIENDFWQRALKSWYATFIWFNEIKSLAPIQCNKQDQRGWVVMTRATDQMVLEFA
jgi:hypothetical protein